MHHSNRKYTLPWRPNRISLFTDLIFTSFDIFLTFIQEIPVQWCFKILKPYTSMLIYYCREEQVEFLPLVLGDSVKPFNG